MGRRGGGFGGGRGGLGGGRGSLGGRGSIGGGRSSSGFGGGSAGRQGGSLGGGAARRGGGLTSGGLAGRSPTPRAPVGGGFGRRAPRRPGFGTGMAVGMGMGMGMRRRRRWGWGFGPRWGFGGGGMHGGHRHGGGGGLGGCLIFLLILVLLAIIVSFAQNRGTGNVGQRHDEFAHYVAPSTRVREPLPAGSASTTGPWYTDTLGWIQNSTTLQHGLRNFHNATGVRPHVYLIGDIDGRIDINMEDLQAYAAETYDRFFNDEAHVLLVFFEANIGGSYEWAFHLHPGRLAQTVLDQEALDIIYDFIVLYYFRDELSEELMFSGAFDRAGARIMYRPAGPVDNRSVWITIAVVIGVILLVFILFNWWKRKIHQQNLEAEQTERILNQPLDSFGANNGDEASRLAQEYEDEN